MLKKVLLVLLAVVLMAGVSAGVSYAVINMHGKQVFNFSFLQPKQQPKQYGPIVDVGEFTVNIDGSSFLKVQISLVLTDKKYEEPIKTLLPVVKDKIIGVLATKTLNDVKSPNGKENLRKELLAKINDAFGVAEINDVLFTSYVYQ